jgi:hypothetical protein
LNTDLAQIELYDAGAESVLAKARSGKPVDRGFEAYLLLCLGRNNEALAILRALFPPTFAEPAPKLYPPYIPRFMLVGTTLLRSGATSQGRTLLLAVIAEVAERPINPAVAAYAWWDVLAFELLGERERAIAALERGVGAGIILDIKNLDTSPLLVDLRSDPRYEKIIAPARERMAAQIAAAQAAGLL